MSSIQNLKLQTLNSSFKHYLNNHTDKSTEITYIADKISTRKSLPIKDHKNKELYITILNYFINTDPTSLSLTFVDAKELIKIANILLCHYDPKIKEKAKSPILLSLPKMAKMAKKSKSIIIEDVGNTTDLIEKPVQGLKIPSILNMDDIIIKKVKSISLVPKGKRPTSDWEKINGRFINRGSWKTTTIPTLIDLGDMGQNRGVPCGKVNKCFVIDLDFYDKIGKDGTITKFNTDNDFIKTFGTIEDIKNNMKDITYIVETARGGLHLYFEYDPLILATINSDFGIDIKTDGGYVVSAGATVELDGVERKYKQVSSTTKFAICPEDLLDWCKVNLVRTKVISKPIKNQGTGEDTVDGEDEWEAYEQDAIDLGSYVYQFSDAELRGILDGLPDEYFNNYELWLKYSTMMRTFNRYDIWNEYNKSRGGSSYDETENLKYWNKKLRFRTYKCDDHIFRNSTFFVQDDEGVAIKDFTGYYQYKPTDNHNIMADEVVEGKRYLDGDVKGSFIDKHNNRIIICRSDTGTGKTTAFKNYIVEKTKNGEHTPFISIVSRISLGEEQHRVFTEAGIDCHLYSDITDWGSYEGENIIITIDSIMKMSSWCGVNKHPFEEYIIYLDEYNSLLEYFLSCPNLDNKRIFVYKKLNYIISTALKVIATDADISDNAINYFTNLPDVNQVDIKYITNDYKHNKGIPCVEMGKYETMRDRLLELDKFMVCCDSKKVAEKFYYDLVDGWKDADDNHQGGTKDKHRIILITSESGALRVNLDDWDMVIFSPKIVYGLDSVMEREVFAYMKGQTITPPAMVQQICRCRKIIKLSYIFEDKRWKTYNYHSLQDVRDEMVSSVEDFSKQFELLGLIDDQKHFNELYANYIYSVDCYKTNFYAHFRDIIIKRGFNHTEKDVVIYRPKMSVLGNTHIKRIKEIKMVELQDFITEGSESYVDKTTPIKNDFKIWKKIFKAQFKNYQNKLPIDKDEMAEMINIADKHPCIARVDLDFFCGDMDDEDYIDEFNFWVKRVNHQYSVIRDEVLKELKIPGTWGSNINLLNIPYERIMEYNEFVQDAYRLTQYFTAKGFFTDDERDYKTQMECQGDFDVVKMTSDRNKIIFLKKIMRLGKSKSKIEYDTTQKVGLLEAKSLFKEFNEIARSRNVRINPFETQGGMSQKVNMFYKQLFGEKILTTKKSTYKNEEGKVKSITTHMVNENELSVLYELAKFAPSKY